ncbi:MAG: hypothetical protein IAE84_19900 [Saprospiraceae bacterium]|nr:hypothetical protein [Saprospiraceae bacterium]HRD82244.1 hypothetical protein [Saprospiraceae bacterium]
MILIDMDALELAPQVIVVDDTVQIIQIQEDTSRNPDTSRNGGYLKVQMVLASTGKVIATTIMHHTELKNLENLLKDE